MKRKELEDLGLEEEVISKILAIHQVDTEANKITVASVKAESAKKDTNIAELTSKLAVYEGVDVEALKEQITALETKYATDLEQAGIEKALDTAIAKSRAKNDQVIKALIKKDLIKKDEKGEISGINEQIEEIQKNESYLFETAQEVVLNTSTGGGIVNTNTGGVGLYGAVDNHYSN